MPTETDQINIREQINRYLRLIRARWYAIAVVTVIALLIGYGVALPVLATYMGHESLSGTQRYLRLTAEMYPDLVATLQARYGQLIPQQERP